MAVASGTGNYSFQGCYAEPAQGGGRALGAYGFVNATAMTPVMCVEGCAGRGFRFAGAEYAQECWCADQLAGGAVLRPEGECNMLCQGDRTKYCGAGGSLSVWRRQ